MGGIDLLGWAVFALYAWRFDGHDTPERATWPVAILALAWLRVQASGGGDGLRQTR